MDLFESWPHSSRAPLRIGRPAATERFSAARRPRARVGAAGSRACQETRVSGVGEDRAGRRCRALRGSRRRRRGRPGGGRGRAAVAKVAPARQTNEPLQLALLRCPTWWWRRSQGPPDARRARPPAAPSSPRPMQFATTPSTNAAPRADVTGRTISPRVTSPRCPGASAAATGSPVSAWRNATRSRSSASVSSSGTIFGSLDPA